MAADEKVEERSVTIADLKSGLSLQAGHKTILVVSGVQGTRRRTGGSDSDGKVAGARSGEAAAQGGKPDAPKGAEVVTPQQKPAQVQQKPPEPEPGYVSNPTFHSKTIEHGDEAGMSVDAPGLDGRKVRFVVEQHVKGDEWKKVGEQTSTVSGGKATAAVEIKAGEQLQEPRYVREGGELAVDATGIADGREVKFIVETERDGQWQAQALVTAVVKSGKAEAPLKLPWGKCRFHAELVPELPEGNVRFHAELI